MAEVGQNFIKNECLPMLIHLAQICPVFNAPNVHQNFDLILGCVRQLMQ